MSVEPGDPEALYVTNDLPGCPSGGLLSGTDKPDQLVGKDGEAKVLSQGPGLREVNELRRMLVPRTRVNTGECCLRSSLP